MPFDLEKYEDEKASGVRSPTGAKRLKKLTGKHLRLINYHMQGMKAHEIALVMDVTQGWISTVLNDPLSKDEIHRRFVDTDAEMYAKATTVIDRSMEADDPAIKLRAAEMVWRSRGKFEKQPSTAPTAEDVVARMLALAAQQGQASITVTAGPPAGPTISGELA